jgi:probable HAF family extracellular repeat protein
MHDLGTLGGANVLSIGNSINGAGQITGESQISVIQPNASSRALLYDGAVMRSLGTLGGDFSAGLGINDAGAIVGYSTTAGNAAEHAILYRNATMVDLNNLIPAGSVTLLYATGINGKGQIAAFGHDSSTGKDGAYLLTPIAGPPVIGNVSVSPKSLWPPNKRLLDVTVAYTATSGSAAVCSLGVASNEPGPDEWTVVDAHHVQLRADRNGNSVRSYTITINCANEAGHSSAQTTVGVANK